MLENFTWRNIAFFLVALLILSYVMVLGVIITVDRLLYSNWDREVDFGAWRVRDRRKLQPSQQLAYQPSGNGISGQAIWLSLAALGTPVTSAMRALESSSGTGATAARTVSSNRSNSTSLMTLSHLRKSTVAKSLCFPIAQIIRILAIRRSRLDWLLISFNFAGKVGGTLTYRV